MISVENVHVSASQIESWLSCRLKWKLGRTAPRSSAAQSSAAQMVGTLTHCAIGEYHRLPPERRDFDALIGVLNYCTSVEVYPSDVISRSEDLLRRFFKAFGADSEVAPTHIEEKFVVENFLKPTPSRGGIDLWLIPDSVTVGAENVTFNEFKTMSKKPNFDQRVNFAIQPLVYKVGLEEVFGAPVTHVDYTFFWPNGVQRERRQFPPSDYWPAYLRGIIEQMFSAPIFPTPGGLCPFCDVYSTCKESALTGFDPAYILDPTEGWQGV